MVMADNTDTFSISIDGEKTGEKWHGSFTVKLFLSHREELRRDAYRRELLGDLAQFASVRQANQADVFSELSVRLVKAPSWWMDSNGGIDMIDSEVVAKVYDLTMGLERKAIDALKAKAEAAKAELAKINASTA